MPRLKLRGFVIDPQSGDYSASRLILLVLCLVVLPALVALEAVGVKLSLWTAFAAIVGSVAGAYGVNSAARVWRGRVLPEKEGK
jgi:hypothetical protein